MIESLSAFPLHTLRLCVKWHYNGPKGDPTFDLSPLIIAEHAMRCITSLRHVYMEIEPTAASFDVQSKVEGDGRLVKFLEPVGDRGGFREPAARFSNDFLEPWRLATGS